MRSLLPSHIFIKRAAPLRRCSKSISTVRSTRGTLMNTSESKLSPHRDSKPASTANISHQGSRSVTNEASTLAARDMLSLFGGSSYKYDRSAQNSADPYETEAARDLRDTYYFHVYATKHNTHITVCTPKHEPMKKLSLSAGNIGFKKANRGTYDAAYQLISFVLSRIVEQGNLAEMKRIEVVMRGFGVGREAVIKAFLGQEGSMIRNRIVAVTDATRLKFGGTRSPKPRRLG